MMDSPDLDTVIRTFASPFRRRPIAVAAVVAAVCCGLRGSSPPPHAAWPAEPALTISPTGPAFRLGTAARPFGWATAIADFNRDGLADTAVADRLSQGPAGYVYEVRFSVSGLPPRSVSFESAQSALTVSIRDVDHDNDLDVVVSEVLSRVVTNVWLNDGQGHFTRAAPIAEPRRLEAARTLEGGRSIDDTALGATTGARTFVDLIFAGFVPEAVRPRLLEAQTGSPRLGDRFFSLPLRAPPTASTLSA